MRCLDKQLQFWGTTYIWVPGRNTHKPRESMQTPQRWSRELNAHKWVHEVTMQPSEPPVQTLKSFRWWEHQVFLTDKGRICWDEFGESGGWMAGWAGEGVSKNKLKAHQPLGKQSDENNECYMQESKVQIIDWNGKLAPVTGSLDSWSRGGGVRMCWLIAHHTSLHSSCNLYSSSNALKLNPHFYIKTP